MFTVFGLLFLCTFHVSVHFCVEVKRLLRECHQFPTTYFTQTSAKKKTELKIASINIRGLGNKVKRQETFKWLREKKYSIFFVQEADCSDSSMHDWRAEWGYQALFSCCSSKKAGVAILFNNNFALRRPRGTFCDKWLKLKWETDNTGKYLCSKWWQSKFFHNILWAFNGLQLWGHYNRSWL